MPAQVAIRFVNEFALKYSPQGENGEDAPLFISGDGIDGYIVFPNCHGVEFTSVNIVLEGLIEAPPNLVHSRLNGLTIIFALTKVTC